MEKINTLRRGIYSHLGSWEHRIKIIFFIRNKKNTALLEINYCATFTNKPNVYKCKDRVSLYQISNTVYKNVKAVLNESYKPAFVQIILNNYMRLYIQATVKSNTNLDLFMILKRPLFFPSTFLPLALEAGFCSPGACCRLIYL